MMVVSVLINNYNYGQYLEHCITSVLNQSYPQIEIILYDDASTDNSIIIANKFKDKIRIINGKEKYKYPSFNQANGINKAFNLSKGEIICLLDSDDYFTTNKVERVVNVFEKKPDVVLVQHALYEIYDNKILNKYDNAYYNIDYLDLYKKKRNTAYFNPTSALSFRREYLKRLLPLNRDGFWRVWPDVRLSRVAPYFGKVKSLDECLGYYRRHNLNDSSSMNSSHLNSLKNQIAHHKYLSNILSRSNLRPINYYRSISFLRSLIKSFIPKCVYKLFNKTYL